MTDLIERLRDTALGVPVCGEAANEIERLRAALKLIVECAVTPDDIDFSWLKMKANEALTDRETDR